MAKIQMPNGTIVEMADSSALSFLADMKGGGGITPWSTIQTGPALFSNPIANTGLGMLMPVLAQMLNVPEATFNPNYSGDMQSSYTGELSRRFTTPKYLEFQRRVAQNQGAAYGSALGGLLGHLSWGNEPERDEIRARMTDGGRSLTGQILTQLAAALPGGAAAMGGDFSAAEAAIWTGAPRAAMMQTGPGHLKWGSDPSRTSAMLDDIANRSLETIMGLSFGTQDAAGGYSIPVDAEGRLRPQLYQANRVFGFRVEEQAQILNTLQTSSVETEDGMKAFADLDKPAQQREMLRYYEEASLIRGLTGSTDLAKIERARQDLGIADRVKMVGDDGKELLHSLTAAAAAIGEGGVEFMDSILKMQQDLGSGIGMSMTGSADAFRDSAGRFDVGFTALAASTKTQGFQIAKARGDASAAGIAAATEDVGDTVKEMFGSDVGRAMVYLNAMFEEGSITRDQLEYVVSNNEDLYQMKRKYDEVTQAAGVKGFDDAASAMLNPNEAAVFLKSAHLPEVGNQLRMLGAVESPQRTREAQIRGIEDKALRIQALTGVSLGYENTALNVIERDAMVAELTSRGLDPSSIISAYDKDGIAGARSALNTQYPGVSTAVSSRAVAQRHLSFQSGVAGMDPSLLSVKSEISHMRGLRDRGVDDAALDAADALVARGDFAGARSAFEAAITGASKTNVDAARAEGARILGVVGGAGRSMLARRDALNGGTDASLNDLASVVGDTRLGLLVLATVEDMDDNHSNREDLGDEVGSGAERSKRYTYGRDYRSRELRAAAWFSGDPDTNLFDVIGIQANELEREDLDRVSELMDPKKLMAASDKDLSGFADEKVDAKMKEAQTLARGMKAAAETAKTATDSGVQDRDSRSWWDRFWNGDSDTGSADASSSSSSRGSRGRDSKAGPGVQTIKGTLTIIGPDKKKYEGNLSGFTGE